jgi:predicted lipoprotein
LAAENREILTEGAFARASVAIQGLPALESLLFEEGVDASAFGSGRESSYRCELMQAIAGNLAAMATEVLEAWTSGTPPVREQVLTAAEGNGHFASGAEVSVLFLRDLRTSLQTVADLKLARPLGEDAPAAKPRRAESWLSGRSLRNIRIDLEAARDLYLTGYAPLLAAIPQTTVLDERIRAAFSEALAADALEASLADQVADPARRPGIGRLLASVRTLEQLVAQELPEALGLTIGFNALDGD